MNRGNVIALEFAPKQVPPRQPVWTLFVLQDLLEYHLIHQMDEAAAVIEAAIIELENLTFPQG